MGFANTKTEKSANCVDCFCKLALFTGSGVLMNNAACGCVINDFDSSSILSLDGFHIVVGNSGLILLNDGLHSGTEHLVLQSLFVADHNALFGGFDIRQVDSPPIQNLRFSPVSASRHERVPIVPTHVPHYSTSFLKLQ